MLLRNFCCTFAANFDIIMSQLLDNGELSFMYRRWAYMLIGIVASLLLFTHPVFNFQDDKGIIYVRSFSMDQHYFYVTQTDLKTGAAEITATSPVKGLYYCNKAMLWGCILCFLCFFSNPVRITISYLTAVISGCYYILVVYYALHLADLHYTTLYPNFMVMLPAIVCAMMILTGKNVIQTMVNRIDKSMENYDAD